MCQTTSLYSSYSKLWYRRATHWGRKLQGCLVTPVSEQIITSAELRKAPSVMIFPAKEMSNSMQEGSREKEIELLRACSELILLITEAGNGPQGLLTAGSEKERDSQCQKQSDTSPKTPAGIAAELLGRLRWIMTWRW